MRACVPLTSTIKVEHIRRSLCFACFNLLKKMHGSNQKSLNFRILVFYCQKPLCSQVKLEYSF